MSTQGVLDDYLEELLGDAIQADAQGAAPAPAPAPAPAAEAVPVIVADSGRAEPGATSAAFDTPTSPGAPAALALLDELMNDPALGPVEDAPAFDTPTSPGAPANLALLDELMNDPALTGDVAAAFDTPTSPGAPANLALLDELMNDPALTGDIAAAFDTPTSPGAPANLALLDELMNDPALTGDVAAAFDTPTSPGAPANLALLDELMNDPALSGDAHSPVAPGSARPAADARPDWSDLPDEALHDTAPVAAVVAAPAPVPTPRPAPAPSARATSAPPAYAANPSRPNSWQELQAQANDPASSPREHRRASERTSRWLRMRCGSQAYALELLKVQEVVLPVPLLPLRGTAEAMLGIMNLRGQVVPVMDLGTHLGAGPAADDANTRIVVLEENGETMGLRVSAVEDVANLTDSQIEPPDTARICQISNDLFRGVARVSAQPMILLDATQLLN